MTGYTVHTGSTEKFSEGWDQIFRKAAKSKGAAQEQPSTPRVKKMAGKKKGKRKSSGASTQ